MSEVQNLERLREDAKELIAERDLALKLYSNSEFKKLILEKFCVQDCSRFAQQSADPALTAEQRADAIALAQAAGHLRRWLSQTVVMGNNAANQMDQLEEEIEVARQEEEGGK